MQTPAVNSSLILDLCPTPAVAVFVRALHTHVCMYVREALIHRSSLLTLCTCTAALFTFIMGGSACEHPYSRKFYPENAQYQGEKGNKELLMP